MIFTLSRATEKELARGSIMQIALPANESIRAKGIIGSLQLPDWAQIIQYDWAALDVIPAPNIDAAQGLVRYLGQICSGREGLDNLRLRVEVVIITIRDGRRKSWGSTYPPKWPASVAFDDGRVLP